MRVLLITIIPHTVCMTPGNYGCSATHATRPLHRPQGGVQNKKKNAEEITFGVAWTAYEADHFRPPPRLLPHQCRVVLSALNLPHDASNATAKSHSC